jgi:hypothetical protein
VPDACDTGTAVLSGVTSGCPVAAQFAASYPARTQALVLAGGCVPRATRLRYHAAPGTGGSRDCPRDSASPRTRSTATAALPTSARRCVVRKHDNPRPLESSAGDRAYGTRQLRDDLARFIVAGRR